jgi:hypothetical protein
MLMPPAASSGDLDELGARERGVDRLGVRDLYRLLEHGRHGLRLALPQEADGHGFADLQHADGVA